MSITGYLYLASVALGVLFLWNASRKLDTFLVADLITGDNGRVSLRKFAALVALFSSTWAFVTLVEQGKLSEWFFTAYIGVWALQKTATEVTEAMQGPKS